MIVDAQGGSYDMALAEIRHGAKRSHWMWFIFPRITGLEHSAMAQRYAIRSLDEARACLEHSVLGRRLSECVTALQDLTDGTAAAVFGDIDVRKLRLSLTLFVAAGGVPLLEAALARWFGQGDPATLEILK